MEYISLRWYDIPELVIPIRVAANKEATEPRVPFGKVEVITSKIYTFRSFPHSRLITGFVTRLTRRVPLVEQKLLTLPNTWVQPPVFSGVRVTRSLVLYICFVDRCLFFCIFPLAIVLSVLLRYTDSDCLFGIFKLFLHKQGSFRPIALYVLLTCLLHALKWSVMCILLQASIWHIFLPFFY